MKQVTVDDVEDLAAGCGILGTGGGGQTYAGALLLQQALERFGPVDLVGLSDLPQDGLVVPIGTIGAPTVGLEKLLAGTEARRLVDSIELRLEAPVVALMAVEIGGANGLKPIAFAAELGLPVLDADGMGRAFPEVQMVSMHVAGVPPGLVLVCDVHGNVAAFEPVDERWAEKLARAAAVAFGGTAVEADWIMTAAQAQGAIIEGTVTRAAELGRALRRHSGEGLGALLDEVGAIGLIEGKIVDVERRTAGGFVRGSVAVEGLGADAGRLLRVEIQNENLVAFEDGRMLACVPDLISLVDDQTGQAVSTELLRFGQRVAVIALACDPIWRTPRGLEVAGPRAFGYDLDYVPVEESLVGRA